MTRARHNGQGTVEYLLGLTAILLALIYAARPGGPLQQAIGGMMTTSKDVMGKSVDNTVTTLKLK